MRYLTDRKRAMGRGAAHRGTGHHWYMQVSAVALIFLVPAFVFIIGKALTLPVGDAWYLIMQPWAAIPLGLAIFVGMRHFAKGATIAIEDYFHGTWRKVLIMAVLSTSYIVTAFGLYALLFISLKG